MLNSIQSTHVVRMCLCLLSTVKEIKSFSVCHSMWSVATIISLLNWLQLMNAFVSSECSFCCANTAHVCASIFINRENIVVHATEETNDIYILSPSTVCFAIAFPHQQQSFNVCICRSNHALNMQWTFTTIICSILAMLWSGNRFNLTHIGHDYLPFSMYCRIKKLTYSVFPTACTQHIP